MRIAVVTGGLELGRDGVGDYARWLAVEATRRGASCRLLAIADRCVDTRVAQEQQGIETIRLPFAAPWASRFRELRSLLDAAPTDWISVQFVPYSFHRSGLPSAFVAGLQEIVFPHRLHVMFHEIWIDGAGSIKRKIVSALQRRSVVRLASGLAHAVHTSNATYERLLRAQGINATVLPLFGSVPVGSSDGREWLQPQFASAGCDAFSRRGEWWLCALFGTLHAVWPPLPLLSDLQVAAAAAGKRVALVSIGRLGSGEALWNRLRGAYAGQIPMVRLGEQSPERISELLNAADFGIATTPLALIGKSATAAAMFDHGLPVIVNREDCPWSAPPEEDPRRAALVVRAGPGLADRLRDVRRLPPLWRLPHVAEQWLDDLSAVAVAAS